MSADPMWHDNDMKQAQALRSIRRKKQKERLYEQITIFCGTSFHSSALWTASWKPRLTLDASPNALGHFRRAAHTEYHRVKVLSLREFQSQHPNLKHSLTSFHDLPQPNLHGFGSWHQDTLVDLPATLRVHGGPGLHVLTHISYPLLPELIGVKGYH